MLNLRFSDAPFMDVVGVAGVVGLVATVARREIRPVVLLVATYLVGAGGGEFLASVPWALLAGIGVAAIAGLVARALTESSPQTGRAIAIAVASLALFLALIGSLGSPANRSSKLHPLEADLVTSMRWLGAHTPAESVVLVPTDEVWGYDEVSEWLPAISGRRSIGTVQGAEWLGSDGFGDQLDRHFAILDCARSTAACYRAIDPDAVIFVPKGELAGPLSPADCCPALRATLGDAGYQVIYDGPGATIWWPGDGPP
jgi:hypothetical protein